MPGQQHRLMPHAGRPTPAQHRLAPRAFDNQGAARLLFYLTRVAARGWRPTLEGVTTHKPIAHSVLADCHIGYWF